MNAKNRLLHSVLLFTLLAFLAGVLFSSSTMAEEQKKKLDLAPAFSLKDLEGKRVALGDLLGQGPILIDFWATWCKPCIKEMPHLHDLYLKYKDRGFLVIAISEDSPRSLSKVKSFVAGNKYEFLVLLDENNAVQRKFNFRALPYTVLLDAEGHIVHSRLGYRPGDEQVLEEQLLPLLKGREKGCEEEAPAEENKKKSDQDDDTGDDQERRQKDDIKKVKHQEAKKETAEGRDE